MILNLTNFRCYTSKKIELPDEGIILLYGTSGIGKTSILKAISFALFGKENKCVKHGEKKCTVEMIYKDLKIIRTKNPNILRLEINDEEKYEGDAAQEIINKIYGKYFNVTSYVAQKSIESFVQLPLAQKMEFFNHLALKDVDINGFKEKTKSIIKSRKELVNTKSNTIRVLKNQLESFNIPDNVKYPLKSGEYNEAEIEKERKANKTNLEKLNNLLKEQKEVQKYLSEINSVKENLDKLATEKEVLINNIETYKKELESIETNYTDYNKIETTFQTILDYLKAKVKYSKESEDFKKFYKNLIDNSEQQISELNIKLKNLNFDTEKFDVLEYIFTNHTVFESIEKDITKLGLTISPDIRSKLTNHFENTNTNIETLEEDINSYKKLIFETEKNIKTLSESTNKLHMKCPSCKTGLSIINDEIKCFDSQTIKEQLELLKKNQEKYNNELNILLDKRNEYRQNIKVIERSLNNVTQTNHIDMLIHHNSKMLLKLYQENKVTQNEYMLLKTSLDRLEYNFEKIKEGTDKTIEIKKNYIDKYKQEYVLLKNKKERIVDEYIEDINNCLLEYDDEFEAINSIKDFDEYDDEDMISIFNDLIKIANSKKIQADNNKNIQTKLEEKIDIINKRIREIDIQVNSYNDSKTVDYNERLEKIVNEIEERSVKKEKFDKKAIQLERFLAYYSEIQRYNKLKDDINYYQKEEKALVQSLSTSENFYKLLLDSETISITNTLENINMNIRYYMDSFFPEGNMQMELTPFKANKKGDKQTGLDIEIYYNGDKIGLDNLSGGEFDRCLLILFLSFNSMVPGDLIMLDECLSSVNSELVEDIVEILKTTLKGKLVLVTLHQANIGIFDHVLNLEK
jgi:DNA repair protein SbcC/Rad50